ncbi:GerMN domain-containing protein [Clostridium sp. BNL1100]|uniref:GerMN domain-containing protein n=1 Tax=Clostridium sp. BNL1100 TaxID=755731 RepID=UPI00024A72D3|nr:GerMN domain-containing protein [Clostridium sp. BNL1100]AEY66814.1 sporulation/spore germination protein [Clostridium sp. BNL1100]
MKINKKRALALLFIVITVCLTLFSACSESKDDSIVEDGSKSAKAIAGSSQVNVRLYKYDVGVTDKPAQTELLVFAKEELENNTLNVLNEVFSSDELSLLNATIDKENKCITVDLPQKVATLLETNKRVADALTYEFVVTLQNIPGIEKVVLTIEGKKDSIGKYHDFKGTFVKIGEITFKKDTGK